MCIRIIIIDYYVNGIAVVYHISILFIFHMAWRSEKIYVV